MRDDEWELLLVPAPVLEDQVDGLVDRHAVAGEHEHGHHDVVLRRRDEAHVLVDVLGGVRAHAALELGVDPSLGGGGVVIGDGGSGGFAAVDAGGEVGADDVVLKYGGSARVIEGN